MERKEKMMVARCKPGRAGVITAGTSSMTVADFMGIRSPTSSRASRGTAPQVPVAVTLYHCYTHYRSIGYFVVTSQAHLNHYGESVPQHLPRGGIRQCRSLGRSHQQRGMEWLWEEIGRASCRKECRSRWSPYH